MRAPLARDPVLLVVTAVIVITVGGLLFHAAYQHAVTPSRPHGSGGLRGTVAGPIPRPDFTLLDTEGRRFDFRAETEGRLALLFLGYTNCPDVCPVHLANLAEALGDLRHEDQRRVRVVFVTTDAERDTPERVRAWLDSFDPRFTGLRGSTDEVNGILAALDLPPAVRGPPDAGGAYDVGHAAAVLAFGPDGPLRALYPLGTRQSDWAHDLPVLLQGPAAAAGGPHAHLDE